MGADTGAVGDVAGEADAGPQLETPLPATPITEAVLIRSISFAVACALSAFTSTQTMGRAFLTSRWATVLAMPLPRDDQQRPGEPVPSAGIGAASLFEQPILDVESFLLRQCDSSLSMASRAAHELRSAQL